MAKRNEAVDKLAKVLFETYQAWLLARMPIEPKSALPYGGPWETLDEGWVKLWRDIACAALKEIGE